MAKTIPIVDYPDYGEEWVKHQQALAANGVILCGPKCKYTTVSAAFAAASAGQEIYLTPGVHTGDALDMTSKPTVKLNGTSAATIDFSLTLDSVDQVQGFYVAAGNTVTVGTQTFTATQDTLIDDILRYFNDRTITLPSSLATTIEDAIDTSVDADVIDLRPGIEPELYTPTRSKPILHKEEIAYMFERDPRLPDRGSIYPAPPVIPYSGGLVSIIVHGDQGTKLFDTTGVFGMSAGISPIMYAHDQGVPVSIAVPVGRLGEAGFWTADNVRDAQRVYGCEIWSHTYTHPASISGYTYADWWREIVQSRIALNELIDSNTADAGIVCKGFIPVSPISDYLNTKTQDSTPGRLIRGCYRYSEGQQYGTAVTSSRTVGSTPVHGAPDHNIGLYTDALLIERLTSAAFSGGRMGLLCHLYDADTFSWKTLIDTIVSLRDSGLIFPVHKSALMSAVQCPLANSAAWGFPNNFDDWTDVSTWNSGATFYSNIYVFNSTYVSLTAESPKRIQVIRGSSNCCYLKALPTQGQGFAICFDAQGWDTNEDVAADCVCSLKIDVSDANGNSVVARSSWYHTFGATKTMHMFPITVPAFALPRARLHIEVSGSQNPNANVVLRWDNPRVVQIGA
ncbi:MAG: hypothetical protein ABFD54_05725 [Armatimonadota bacterium]|nr:hypothetical protein [bacterium]